MIPVLSFVNLRHGFNCLICCAVFSMALPGNCGAAPNQIVVEPGDDLARLVVGSSPGTAFVLRPGRHYTEGVVPKDGQSFEGQPGAILSGAVRLGPFTAAGSYWKAKGPPPLPPSHGSCDPRSSTFADACTLREALFIDGVPLTRVSDPGLVRGHAWYQDRSTGDVTLAFDPGKQRVELSYHSFAFSGSARNVTIRQLTIEQFASIAQHGAIYGDTASGWTIRDNVIRFNSGAGITTGNAMRVRSNRVVANGQIGIAGKGNDLLIEANEIADNNTHGFDPVWESGGTKFVLSENLIFVRNCVHDNMGPGIWTDIDNRNSSILGNWSIKNSGAGIFHEISGRAVIADNVSALNGSRESSPWGAQILVSGSIDTLVWRNKVEVAPDYGHGIFIVEEGRANKAKTIHDRPEYASTGNAIIGNEITYEGAAGLSGYYSKNWDVSPLTSANIFEDNSTIVDAGGTARFKIGTRFRIGDKTLSLAEAQERGQELRSRLTEKSGSLKNESGLSCPAGTGSRPAEEP